MHKNNWMDFTPLIDVFLILLFVILLNSQIETKNQSEAYDTSIENYQSQINALEVELEAIKSTIPVSEIEPFDLVKYGFLEDKINVVDVSLRTTGNRLWINDDPTDLYLIFTDQSTPEARSAQKTRIKKVLMDELQSEKVSNIMTLFTLEEDGKVYRYAYLLVTESITELIQELGIDQTFFLPKP